MIKWGLFLEFRMLKHMQLNQCNTQHQQIEEKNTVISNNAEKSFDTIQYFHDITTQQTRNKRKTAPT